MFSNTRLETASSLKAISPRPFSDRKLIARWRDAALKLEASLLRLRLLEKANFDPDQPRDDRGRWSDQGKLARVGRVLANVGRGTLRASLALARTTVPGRAVSTALYAAEHLPYVMAYFDEPKSLEELQQLAAIPRRGYDVHHIVERAAARRLGMRGDEIDAPSNLVRISTFKHWELNSWYETPSLIFSNQPPRKYLDGKDAEEHRRVGLIGLNTVGVLAP